MLYTQFVNRPSAEELWHLSKESVENPQKAIYRFFDTYGLASSYERLWQMLRLTIGSEEINEWNAAKRSNCFHFNELLLDLLKSNYVLFLKMRGEVDNELIRLFGNKP